MSPAVDEWSSDKNTIEINNEKSRKTLILRDLTLLFSGETGL